MKDTLRKKIQAFLDQKVTVGEMLDDAGVKRTDNVLSIKKAITHMQKSYAVRATMLLQEILKDASSQNTANQDTSELRAEFEFHNQDLDLSRHPKSNAYKSTKTRDRWQGFQNYHNRIVMARPSPERDFRVEGQYIIGSIQENGRPYMSLRPFCHANRPQALAEAERLAKEHHKDFAVFRCLEVVKGKKEET